MLSFIAQEIGRPHIKELIRLILLISAIMSILGTPHDDFDLAESVVFMFV